MDQKSKIQLLGAISVLAFLMFTGTIAYRYLEKWTFIQSLYFSVTTLTTIGYGDFVPTTDISRLFTVFFMIIGVATSLTALGIIALSLIKKEDKIITSRIKK